MNMLIVEDQTMVRELLVLACAQAVPEATLRSAGRGDEALVECRREAPDLVLLDLVLPDGDGLDLWKKILELAPRAKAIALSSHIDEFTLHRALSFRVHGILDKNAQPVKILAEAVTAVM